MKMRGVAVAAWGLWSATLALLALTFLYGSSDLTIAGSTLAVAALFRPLRARVQGFIDRRFYRRKFDTQRTLESFSARLRDEIDLETLNTELLTVEHETMRPSHVSLWLRPSEVIE